MTAVVVAVFTTAALPSPTTASVGSSRCQPRPSTTLVTGRLGRVYSVPLAGPARKRAPEGARVYGCLFAAGRPVLLGRTFAFLDHARVETDAFALHAPRVAYAETFMGVDFNRVHLVVRDLRTGKVEQEQDAAPKTPLVESFTSVADIELTGTGAVAWSSEKTSMVDRRHPAREVAATDSSGLTVLDEGEGIDVHSLTLPRSKLSWLDGGVPRSVFLR